MAYRPQPALAALACAAAIAATPAAAMAAGDCVPAPAWPAARAGLARQVVGLVNAHRRALGLAPLAISPTLTAAATWKARDLAAFGYFAHDDAAPVVRTVADRIAACGYAPGASWGENIAAGATTARAVVRAWLASAGHRANIEARDFRATGVAAAGAPPSWVETFGSIVDRRSSVPAPAPGSAGPSALRVRCSGHRVVTCRVRARAGTRVRAALVRARRTYARARGVAAAGALSLRLRPARRLAAGRYDVVVRAGAHRRRLALSVR